MFVKGRLCFHHQRIKPRQDRVIAICEGIVLGLVDGVIGVANTAIDGLDGMANSTGNTSMCCRIIHIIVIGIDLEMLAIINKIDLPAADVDHDQVGNFRLESTNMRERPEYRVGPILGDRVLVLRGGELKAISLKNGEEIWRTNAAPKSGFVLSDGQRVAVVSATSQETVFFDIADGRELDRTPFEFGELWRSAGEHVLCYQETEEDGVFDIRLVDPFTGKVVLSQKANAGSKPNKDSTVPAFISRFFSGHHLLMMSPAGETFIWDRSPPRRIAC